MSNITPDVLDAAEALMDEEMNAGESAVEPARASDSGATPELNIDDQGVARDDKGRFLSRDTVNETLTSDQPETLTETEEEFVEALEEAADSKEEEVPTDVGTEEEVESAEDDVLEIDPDHPFFAKYGGDPEAALKALEEAQSLVGNRNLEIGQVRQEMAQMRQMLEQMNQQPVYQGPYQNDIDENPEALVYEAMERADGETLHKALAAWGEEDPFRATTFLMALPGMLETMEADGTPNFGQPAAPDNDLAEGMEALKSRAPDLQQNLPVIGKLAAERPMLGQALHYGTPQERVQALEDLNAIARSQTKESDTSATAKRVVLKAKAEAEAARADAHVVSASRGTVSSEDVVSSNQKLQDTLRQLSGLDDLIIE